MPPCLNAEFTTHWPERLEATELTASTLRNFGLFPWKIESANVWWSRPLKTGEISCSIGHILCWRAIAVGFDDAAVILEDDVVFGQDFCDGLSEGLEELRKSQLPWDLLYLGRFPLEHDQGRVGRFVVPGYSHCTFAYIVTRRCAKQLVEAKLDQHIIPVDEFLPAMYLDHPREDVRRVFPKRLSALAFDPPLTSQVSKEVAGSDTEDSEYWLA